MNNYLRRKLSALLVIIFLLSALVGLPLFWLYNRDTLYQMVLPAISMSKAKKMLKDEECIMIRCKEYEANANSLFYFKNKGKEEQIFLIGNSPYYELSRIFFEPEENCFIIKGYFDNKLTEFIGEKVFNVDSWYFVEPIKRSYVTGTDSTDAKRPNRRFFAPKDGLDEYDVEQEDYSPLGQLGDIFMESFEMQYYAEQEGYYLIAPYYEETKLKWYLIQSDFQELEFDRKQEVILNGNTPQYVLHNTILDNTREMGKNCFLIRGEISESEEGEKSILIYRWWLHRPFYPNSILIGSRWGFTQKDIENNIYSIYR